MMRLFLQSVINDHNADEDDDGGDDDKGTP